MKSLLAFWKKDIINKLILFVLFLLLAGASAFIFVIINPPEGISLQGMFSQFFTTPTSTLDVDAAFTHMAQTKIVAQTPAYLRGAATITPGDIRPTGLPATSTLTPLITTTPSPEETATATISAIEISGAKCIPITTPQVGRVLDILDGVSVKVLLEGLVYNVRYIGIDLPEEFAYADVASMLNGQLVWGRDVKLYTDLVDKDGLGQLLRYVVVDETLVNLELIQKGLVSKADIPPGFACAKLFLDAEQAAKAANLGQWHK